MELELVDTIPALLKYGVLYFSRSTHTAAHLCACGCGDLVNLSLEDTGWELNWEYDELTLRASFGNGRSDCQTKYQIRDGRVYWSTPPLDKEWRQSVMGNPNLLISFKDLIKIYDTTCAIAIEQGYNPTEAAAAAGTQLINEMRSRVSDR